jgi:hypothetical protein
VGRGGLGARVTGPQRQSQSQSGRVALLLLVSIVRVTATDLLLGWP